MRDARRLWMQAGKRKGHLQGKRRCIGRLSFRHVMESAEDWHDAEDGGRMPGLRLSAKAKLCCQRVASEHCRRHLANSTHYRDYTDQGWSYKS
jgi:hypothetical protein